MIQCFLAKIFIFYFILNEVIFTLSLNDQTKFRLGEINKIKDYFEFEIKEREAVIKNLSKYTAALDYTDKRLFCLQQVQE